MGVGRGLGEGGMPLTKVLFDGIPHLLAIIKRLTILEGYYIFV